jgi:hypothetical protein
MGKWLAALRTTSEKKSGNAPDANPQNPQNHPEIGFGGFGGSRSSDLTKIDGGDGGGFGGFGGSASGHFLNFYDRAGWDEEDWQAAFDERVGILEFDEGLPRSEAARIARQQIDEQRRMVLQ